MSHIEDKPCVLLVNLGSPDEPETKATRRYLRQFLSDRRVIEMHPVLWRPILEGIILRVRPKDSAAKYRTVWGKEYSPLLAGTIAQTDFVAAALKGQAEVRFAMRYGSHGIAEMMDQAFADGYRKLLVVPLYPQYSATTIASVTDEVYRWNLARRDQFALRVARSFQTDPGYIEAMAVALEEEWARVGRPNFDEGDRLVLSYHGIPKAMATKGDPYPYECTETTRALRSRLGVPASGVMQTFQSKFGPAPWLLPATIDTMAELGASGTRRVDVVCPGFVSDCLETLEEIDELNREAFLGAGGAGGSGGAGVAGGASGSGGSAGSRGAGGANGSGGSGGAEGAGDSGDREFHYVPWGNDALPWLEALEGLVRRDLAGWV